VTDVLQPDMSSSAAALDKMLARTSEILGLIVNNANLLFPAEMAAPIVAAWPEVSKSFPAIRKAVTEISDADREGVGLTGVQLEAKVTLVKIGFDRVEDRLGNLRDIVRRLGQQGVGKVCGVVSAGLAIVDVPLGSIPGKDLIPGFETLIEFKCLVEAGADFVSQIAQDDD
jgi:hypothetical protein